MAVTLALMLVLCLAQGQDDSSSRNIIFRPGLALGLSISERLSAFVEYYRVIEEDAANQHTIDGGITTRYMTISSSMLALGQVSTMRPPISSSQPVLSGDFPASGSSGPCHLQGFPYASMPVGGLSV